MSTPTTPAPTIPLAAALSCFPLLERLSRGDDPAGAEELGAILAPYAETLGLPLLNGVSPLQAATDALGGGTGRGNAPRHSENAPLRTKAAPGTAKIPPGSPTPPIKPPPTGRGTFTPCG